ncbi:zinc-ribbon domain-containing protein [Ramlibacter sp. XY19]|uniref:DUF3426 domain-containing protein n=1 Tax=Ramlibacter paludis TaxID=2908000 RepID=UPI0023DC902B|nr:DUF3426 domain-containing protein [Ramlibacter paludis]MCG2595323.1 zinc-ribbon domain-containing protein [Ramlibacter paludis]
MSLTTSCPSCGTMFRVVPDQLKISEGWVRCGHCSEVFDATAHLAEEIVLEGEPEPPAPAPAQSAPSIGASNPEGIRGWEPTATAGLTQPAALPSGPAPLAPQIAALRAEAERDPRPTGPDSQALEALDLDEPFVFRRSDFVERDPVPSVLPPAGPSISDSRLGLDEDEQRDDFRAPPPDVSFVRQARRKAFWRRPVVRTLMLLSALLLAAALAGQWAYQERDRLALSQPALRPALQMLCDQLRCTLGPPRQIEAVAIDSSGFNKLRSDTYRLSFTLKNSAGVPVAAPAMELTLTDAQDQPLLRRVLTPAELGAPDNVIPAASDWSGAVGIVVLPSSGGPRIAGYRLLAFYP